MSTISHKRGAAEMGHSQNGSSSAENLQKRSRIDSTTEKSKRKRNEFLDLNKQSRLEGVSLFEVLSDEIKS